MKTTVGRVTIKTLAAELGLSVCTIHKALTGRPRISDETRRRVQKAAARLGYQPNRLARTLVRPVLSLGVVRPDAWPSHMELLVRGVRERLSELRDHRVTGDFRRVSGFRNGAAFIREIERLTAAGAAGCIVILGDYPTSLRRRIWTALDAARIPFVLLGEVPERMGSLTRISHDCDRCGRMAADLLGGMVGSAPVAIFVGRREVPDHRDKIAGFTEECRRQGLPLSGVGEAFDDPARAFPAAARLFKEHPETGGLYIGTENADGILRYLREHKLAGRVRVVATGNSPAVLNGIERGLIRASLYQNQPEQGRRAVDALFRFLETGDRPPQRIQVEPTVLLRSNADLWPRAGGDDS